MAIRQQQDVHLEEASRSTHTARALMELRKKILSGDYPGGTRLFEVPLAETLQISRTPVREIMSRLAEEGLLDRLANGGFVVRSFTYADAVDAIELRGVLEGTAARLAAERGVSQTGLQQLRDLLAQLDACFGQNFGDVDLEAYSGLNAEFHALLVKLSGSTVIRREVERSTRLPFASPSAFLSGRTHVAAFRQSLHIAQDQHRSLVAAVAGREGARAEALAREHARIARKNLEYAVYEDPQLMLSVPGLVLLSS
ncbi:GntR family transcriptional regulator [Rhizobium deserti]|uniref:GntR family transcriptional regulator n=1 Tax=Rhizobium deserti TaxID=2547961 RepID=A0A4R5UFS8_9HYPH|nr:GntR family transcriptional regulator [Rhizobium deserti]TDK34371.1 GntR family transcriptional regulator [Rhizobium deserti]